MYARTPASRAAAAILPALLAALAALALLTLATVAHAAPRVMFRDEFTGHAFKRAWQAQACGWANKQSTGDCDPRAPRLDGRGHLILPATPTVGALTGTFDFDAGFPTPRDRVRAAWRVPFTIAVRAKLPATGGYTGVAWMERLDSWEDNAELDFGEETTSRKWTAQAFQHVWHRTTPCPADARCFDGDHSIQDGARRDVGAVAGAWHTYGMRVTLRHVTYLVDGRTLRVAEGVRGGYGLVLQNIAGIRGSWIAGYPEPELAPWPAPSVADQAVVDSVVVTRP
jgi:hypothetical protein